MTQLNIRIKPETKKALKLKAISLEMPLEKLVSTILFQYLEEKGKENEEEEAFKIKDPGIN